MAHFALTHASWPDGFVPGHASFEDLDLKTSKAINGDNGGAWAPDSIIQIRGKGLSARHVYELLVVGPDANTTFVVASSRLIYLDATITADRTYTLGATDAVNGDVMEIAVLPAMSAARTITVKDNLGATIAQMGNVTNTGTMLSAKFVYIGAQWRLMSSRRNGYPIVTAGGVGSAADNDITSTSPVDISGFTASLDCIQGDILMVSMNLAVSFNTSGSGAVSAVVIDGGVPATVATGSFKDFGDSGVARPISGTFSYAIAYLVQNTGGVTWKGKASVASGSHMLLGGSSPATISLLQIRQ